MRIHNRLVEEHGYTGSTATTMNTVRELRLEMKVGQKEVFIPSDPEKREGAEMDWGELFVDLNGKRTKHYLFVIRSKYSGKVFARLYPAMIQACFFDAHIRAFAYFEGVFSTMVYDNLKTAVKQVLKGKERIEQEAFVDFRTHYNYEAQFCSIAKGSEKGGVEGSVGYVRRNFLTPIPKVDSLEELNKQLLEKCFNHQARITSGQTHTIGFLAEKEQPTLQPIPKNVYSNCTLHPVIVDKYSTVKLKRNRYSVPSGYKGKDVVLEVGLSDVRIVYKNELITTHKREYRRDRWVINPWHYLEALQRKPGAFKSSRILTEIEQSWDPVVKKTYDLQIKKYGAIEGTKEFIATLLCFKDRTYEDMISVLELSLEQKRINKETVALIAESTGENIITLKKQKLMKFLLLQPFQSQRLM